MSRSNEKLGAFDKSNIWLVLFGAAAVLPLLVSFVTFLGFSGLPDRCMDKDMAMLELYTRHASHGKQLLGPYSRFVWNHPGPAYFYLLAPLYILSGESSSSLFLSARLINLLAVFFSVWLLLRLVKRSDPLLAAAATALLAVYICRLGPGLLSNPWNPWIIVLPFAFLLFCLAGLASGRIALLPAVAGIGTFLVQTHVALIPCVLALAVTSLVLLTMSRCRRGSDSGRLGQQSKLVWLIATAILFGVMWLPPVLEEVRNHPGNLWTLYSFFGRAGTPALFSEAFLETSKQLAWLPLLLLKKLHLPVGEFEYDLLAELIAICQFAFLLVSYLIARKEKHDYRACLCVIGAVASVAALCSVMQVRGGIFPYLLAWVSAAGLVNWAVIGATLAQIAAGRLRERGVNEIATARLAIMTTAAVLAAILIVSVPLFFRESVLAPDDSEKVKHLSEGLVAYLHRNGDQRALIHFNWSEWSVQTGIVLQLAKSGCHFSVRNVWRVHGKDWPLLLGESHAPTGAERLHVVVGSEPRTAGSRWDCLATYGGSGVYVCDKKPSGASDTKTTRGNRVNY